MGMEVYTLKNQRTPIMSHSLLLMTSKTFK